jgi:hypothetical protein
LACSFFRFEVLRRKIGGAAQVLINSINMNFPEPDFLEYLWQFFLREIEKVAPAVLALARD